MRYFTLPGLFFGWEEFKNSFNFDSKIKDGKFQEAFFCFDAPFRNWIDAQLLTDQKAAQVASNVV